MTDKVCYPTSHLPFYILGIIFISFLFFMYFWQSNENNNYYHVNYQCKPNYYQRELFYPDPNTNPNVMTFGNHSSSHTSAIHASPYVPGINLPPVSPGVDLPPYRYH